MNHLKILVFLFLVTTLPGHAQEVLTTTQTGLVGIIYRINILPNLAWGHLRLVGQFNNVSELTLQPARDISFHTIYASPNLSIQDLEVNACVLFNLQTSEGLREWASLQEVIPCPLF